jgi:hypothetical protein
MAKGNKTIEIYLETGQKKTFAGALDWPGWCRSGKDEAAALLALVDYGPRYAQILKGTGLGFHAPDETAELVVVERVKGNATTDFGAPDRPLPGDDAPVDPAELERWEKILKACWRAFDAAVEAASGKSLAKGPRGGGRDLAKMVGHVLESDQSYLSALGGKFKQGKGDSSDEAAAGLRRAVLETLAGRVSGEVPAEGPRGGARWAPRYFVRRLAWHCLDHAWEIEDRAT